jgi:dephospho-CoA kinase
MYSGKIAITGSISSGKSFVCNILSLHYSTPYFSSDEAVRAVHLNPLFVKLVLRYFGKSSVITKNNDKINNFIKNTQNVKEIYPVKYPLVKQINNLDSLIKAKFFIRQNQKFSRYKYPSYNSKYLINKQYIVQNILPNIQKMKILESITYRYLRILRKNWIAQHSNYKSLLFETPLLFEKKLQNQYNKIICVSLSKKNRFLAAKNRGLDECFFKTFDKRQFSPKIKQKLSHRTIYNFITK